MSSRNNEKTKWHKSATIETAALIIISNLTDICPGSSHPRNYIKCFQEKITTQTVYIRMYKGPSESSAMHYIYYN